MGKKRHTPPAPTWKKMTDGQTWSEEPPFLGNKDPREQRERKKRGETGEKKKGRKKEEKRGEKQGKKEENQPVPDIVSFENASPGPYFRVTSCNKMSVVTQRPNEGKWRIRS